MTKFNILPTDPRWLDMTTTQIEWIILNMFRDEEEASRKGRNAKLDGEFEDYDDSWYDTPHEEFTPIREGDDEAEIARQLEAITSVEDKIRLKARLEASDELDEFRDQGGTTIEEDITNSIIAENVRKALEEAKRIEKYGNTKWGEKSEIELEEERKNMEFSSKLEQGNISDAIALFEGKEMGLPSIDDDFEI